MVHFKQFSKITYSLEDLTRTQKLQKNIHFSRKLNVSNGDIFLHDVSDILNLLCDKLWLIFEDKNVKLNKRRKIKTIKKLIEFT